VLVDGPPQVGPGRRRSRGRAGHLVGTVASKTRTTSAGPHRLGPSVGQSTVPGRAGRRSVRIVTVLGPFCFESLLRVAIIIRVWSVRRGDACYGTGRGPAVRPTRTARQAEGDEPRSHIARHHNRSQQRFHAETSHGDYAKGVSVPDSRHEYPPTPNAVQEDPRRVEQYTPAEPRHGPTEHELIPHGASLSAHCLRGSLVAHAVLVALATRLACLAALAVAAGHVDRPLSAVLTVFDGAYYRQIAAHGYPAGVPNGHGTAGMSPLAFFPLYPGLLGGLKRVGLSFAASAVILDTASALAAAALIALIVGRWAGDRAAILTAALWSTYPLAVVLSLAYPEALFTMLAAGCLLALARNRTALAGGCAALAGLTRPTGIVLVVVCLFVAVHQRSIRAFGAAVIGASGISAWVLYLALHTGHADAWLLTERQGWNGYFDGGIDNIHRAIYYLTHPTERPAATAVALLIIALSGLLVAAWRQPMPRHEWLYAVLLFVVAVGTHNVYSAVPRFVLPAFPLLAPIGVWLAERPRVLRWSVAAIATGVMMVCGVYVTLYSTYPP